MAAHVVAVHADADHSFSKSSREFIQLLAGLGVDGDAHCGATTKHRSRLPRQASWPNLRQVHLIHGELHDELAARGFTIAPGQMGENITTRDVDLLALPTRTLLRIANSAIIEITGLRNPCQQLDGLQPGLMAATLTRDEHGDLVRLAGVMGIIAAGGIVRPGDRIEIQMPHGPREPLTPV